MTPEVAQARLEECMVEAIELARNPESSIRRWHGRTESLLDEVFGPGHRFTDEFAALDLTATGGGGAEAGPGDDDAARRRNAVSRLKGLTRAATLLDAAIFDIGRTRSVSGDRRGAPSAILLVDGGDARRADVARALRQLTGDEPATLGEPPHRGQAIIEGLGRHAGDSAFAVVLATGDDRAGGDGSARPVPRAGQDWIFAMGFLVAALGRSRVALLHDEGVEPPSACQGATCIPFDDRGAWRHELASELREAGIRADADDLA